MWKNSVLFCLLGTFLLSCNSETESYSALETSQSGEVLAAQYCQMCHQLPSPELLDKKSWKEYVLPRMGYMLGIYEEPNVRASLIEPGEAGELVNRANIFPEKPMLKSAEWEKIVAHYLTLAPEKLPQVSKKKITKDLTQFELIVPSFTISPPSTTLLQLSSNGHIYLGDAMSKKFLEFDTDLSLIKSGNVNEGAVSLKETNEQLLLTVMGSFSPTDNPSGFILDMPKNGGSQAKIIADKLRRPVHTAYGDLNQDGFVDAVVSEFGKWTGRLSLLLNDGKGNFTKSILINQSGATKSILSDFNKDGYLDIIALFGQGNESIYILYNDGQGNFSPKRVLQFSPSNGSSSFDLFDYNQDGFLDIIYTAGDNADFQPVMKPYHGVYIYQNDGMNQFEQVFFYQLNGAYAAKPFDFDMDGDIDIAAISFFPDYAHSPEESFVYLKNDGNNNFTASTFQTPAMGRWIIMEPGDIDQDGDLDLILGSLAFEIIPKNDSLMNQWMERGVPFVVLKNTHLK
jgi:hypothetical protein